MKTHLLAAIILVTGAQSALAESCRDSFVRLMTERTTKEPTKVLVTQEIQGGAKTVNWNYQDGKGNWRTEMVEPANAPWSMGLNDVLYTSADKGKTVSRAGRTWIPMVTSMLRASSAIPLILMPHIH